MSKILIGTKENPVRFSYAQVWEPRAVEEGATPKYSVSILIPKSDKAMVKAVKDAIEAAKKEGAPKWGGKIPANLKQPLRDGDVERPDDDTYVGHYYIGANSTTKPQIVDESVVDIIDRNEFYSGCYGRASVNFYAFNVGVNKGVACGLANLQKLKDGPSLGGGSTAAQDFGDDDDEI
jgi:hypothetical protein